MQTLHDVASDMSGACSCSISEEAAPEQGGGAQLVVDSCLFHDVFSQEGLPHLVRFFCCQHNLTFLKVRGMTFISNEPIG